MTTWFRPAEKMPEHGQCCLVVWAGAKQVWLATYFTGEWMSGAGYVVRDANQEAVFPLRWAALPDIPAEQAPVLREFDKREDARNDTSKF